MASVFVQLPASGAGAGVGSLNGLTGTLSLVSTDASVTITPSGTQINLQAAGGGTTITLGAFGSTPNANGLSLSGGGALNMQPADGTHPGGVSIAAQTLAGAKTFSTPPILSSLTASLPLQLDGSKNVVAAQTSLTTGVTGVLPVANGGTGHSTNVASLGITIDGGGVAPSTGVKGYLYVPYACTITAVTLLANASGSCVIDIWKVAYASFPPLVANTITASDLPTLSSAQNSQDTTLTGWTTSISAGDVLAFNVNSASTLSRVSLTLTVSKT